MSLSFDPLFTLQMLFALFVMMTLQDEPAEAKATTAQYPSNAPFQLSDGHTYVEHAGMTIEKELYSSFYSE